VPYFGLIQLIGKFLFIAGLYVFIYWIFRELFRSLREESAAGTVSPAARLHRPAVETPSGPGRAQPVAPARAAPAAVRQPEAAPAVKGKPCLVVRDPGGSGLTAGTVLPLTAAVTIGRARENSIQVSDRFASGQHAIIFLKGGRRILRDRGSTNGTFRNGKRITAEVALSNGDLVTVGTTVLEYRSDGGT